MSFKITLDMFQFPMSRVAYFFALQELLYLPIKINLLVNSNLLTYLTNEF